MTRVPSPSLADLLERVLEGDPTSCLEEAEPRSRRDRFLTLLRVYDLHTAPLATLGDAARLQGDPAVAAVKQRLEQAWLAELEQSWAAAGQEAVTGPEQAVAAMRAVAAQDRLPESYRWLAQQADWPQVVEFLALEGGPDGGFDDLVAGCQVGLTGGPKLELARNYWDEMGGGDPDAVHTVLHDRLVAAVGMPRVPRADQPVAALERAALGGLLATNRWLQPEMVGALGLLELQAGPRCRLVLQAFDRLGAPEDAYPFYSEHAEVDPRHGKDWVEKAIAPLVAEHPAWGDRIVKGAWWRATVNLAFFADLHRRLAGELAHAA
ncbi:MAG: iron-containing redox enzyme family protein [Mycobacteriales bacterium]